MANESRLDTPLGQMKIVCSNKGLTKVKFLKEGEESFTGLGAWDASSGINNLHLKMAKEWFEVYFKNASKTKTMDLPQLDLDAHSGKPFICKVWQVLKERVGPGETISYGKLAELCGSPKAARAVGQAMRTNPFTILVPCHRVINGSGGLGNYSGGVEKKKWLLNHEGKHF